MQAVIFKNEIQDVIKILILGYDYLPDTGSPKCDNIDMEYKSGKLEDV